MKTFKLSFTNSKIFVALLLNCLFLDQGLADHIVSKVVACGGGHNCFNNGRCANGHNAKFMAKHENSKTETKIKAVCDCSTAVIWNPVSNQRQRFVGTQCEILVMPDDFCSKDSDDDDDDEGDDEYVYVDFNEDFDYDDDYYDNVDYVDVDFNDGVDYDDDNYEDDNDYDYDDDDHDDVDDDNVDDDDYDDDDYDDGEYNDGDYVDDWDFFCINGGTCRNLLERVDKKKPCDCPAGYTGRHCEYHEFQVEECSLDCSGHGVCEIGVPPKMAVNSEFETTLENTDAFTSSQPFLHCICDQGYTGTNCDYEYVHCGGSHNLNEYCFHGSTCVQDGSDTICECDYQGRKSAGPFCEYRPTDTCESPLVSLPGEPWLMPEEDGMTWDDFPFCVNNGVCLLNPISNRYYCECSDDRFDGERCEKRVDGKEGDTAGDEAPQYAPTLKATLEPSGSPTFNPATTTAPTTWLSLSQAAKQSGNHSKFSLDNKEEFVEFLDKDEKTSETKAEFPGIIILTVSSVLLVAIGFPALLIMNFRLRRERVIQRVMTNVEGDGVFRCSNDNLRKKQQMEEEEFGFNIDKKRDEDSIESMAVLPVSQDPSPDSHLGLNKKAIRSPPLQASWGHGSLACDGGEEDQCDTVMA